MTAPVFDPYALVETHAPSVTPSLTALARKRLDDVIQTGFTTWLVGGNTKLGDAYKTYAITFAAGAYDCACFHSKYGDTRAKGMCSHVLAVILHRQKFPLDTSTHTEDTDTPTTSPLVAGGTAGVESLVAPPTPAAPPSEILPTDPRWGAPALPTKFTHLRQHQVDAVDAIEEAFTRCNLVFVDAPVGSGKTIIGELARRRVAKPLDKEGKGGTLYVCSSIPLQNQFVREFDYARPVRGKSNYLPYTQARDASCADCTGGANGGCAFCPDLYAETVCEGEAQNHRYPGSMLCGYWRARWDAEYSDLAVLNTTYWLHAANYANAFADRDLVIVDEADMLESELMGFVEFRASHLAGLKDFPGEGAHKTTICKWLGRVCIPLLRTAVKPEMDAFGKPVKPKNLSEARAKQEAAWLLRSARLLLAELTERPDNWTRVYGEGPLTFKAVKVHEHGPRNVWAHGKKFLLMSGTLVSPESIAASLGYDQPFETVQVPHTFPLAHRRVVVAPVANVTHKEKDTAYPALANALCNIAALHPTERVLVHTVSYALTRYLHDALDTAGFSRRTLSYTQAKDRDKALRRFRATPGGILLAPSMDRGIDLPGDDCRVQVVCKVPYASLGDKQVSARLHTEGGQTWFSANTVRSLVQMTGRAVRSADDWAVTYIIDSQFQSNVVKKSKHLLPGWFAEALDYEFPVSKLTRPFSKV